MKKKVVCIISLFVMVNIFMGLLTGCAGNLVSSEDDTSENVVLDVPKPTGNTVLNELPVQRIQSKDDALVTIQETSTITGIDNVYDTLGEVNEFFSLDSKFYRFTQIYEGIPVYGRSVTVGVSLDGRGQGLSHNYASINDVDIMPVVSEKDAKQIVGDRYGKDMQITTCNLTIYTLFDYVPTLAWQIQVVGPALLDTCFVDAHTGEFITSFSGVFTTSEVGTYTDSNGTIDFYTIKNEDASYSLVDEKRNLNVYDANYQTVTYAIVDAEGNVYSYDKNLEKWVDSNCSEVNIPGADSEYGRWNVFDIDGNIIGQNADYFPCVGNPLTALHILTNPTTSWSNQKAAAAMSLTEDVYDFYQCILGRTGFNGNNGMVRISVNDDINGDSRNAYSSMGNTRAFTVLSFGHAGTITADLVGHEFNHSVEQAISGLVYQNESGAIMEALADVFGELSEDWIGDRQLDDDCDWIHGDRNMMDPSMSTQEYCYYEYNGQECPVKAEQKDGKHIIGKKIKEPGWFSSGSCWIEIPYPKYFQGDNYFYGSYDKGGVHTNNTVISHAAYLMIHPDSTGVSALTNEELARVLYYAMSYMPSDCGFNDFASYVCLSAEVLKLSEAKQDCIVRAFHSVGVEASNVMIVEIEEEDLNTEQESVNVYKDILDMFYNSISCNWSNCDGDGWENVYDPDNACYLFRHYLQEYSLEEIGYTMLDLNRDGQSELIVSPVDAAEAGEIYDLYAISNEKIIHVASAGERCNYNLANDYSINSWGSGSALTSDNTNYYLDNGGEKLEINQRVIYDGYMDEANPYFYSTEEHYDMETDEVNYAVLKSITKDEATDILNSFPENISIELIPFSEYVLYEDMTNANFLSKSESELKAYAETQGIVSAWEYADYDGNGTKEAFAIITDEHLNILKTLFISSEGELVEMENNLHWSLYTNDEGHIRYVGDKGFFWASMGAGGSGWLTILYSVKDNIPYKLQLSGQIQGFYESGSIIYTTENEFLPEGGHVYPNVELIYDSSLQEFIKGERITIDN